MVPLTGRSNFQKLPESETPLYLEDSVTTWDSTVVQWFALSPEALVQIPAGPVLCGVLFQQSKTFFRLIVSPYCPALALLAICPGSAFTQQ